MRVIPAATAFKRLAIAIAGLVAAVFVVLVGLSFLIPATAVREAVKEDIADVTGLNPTLLGGMSVSLFPHANVIFHDVELRSGASAEPAVVADELTARLRYFPLLAGRIEIADVSLVRPMINVSFSAHNRSNWSGLAASLARALAPNPDRAASFTEIGIRDGIVLIHAAGKPQPERLSNVDFQLAWPAISHSFASNGHFTWHRQAVQASLTISDFLAALTGKRTGIKLRLSAKPVKVTFDGAGSKRKALQLMGALNVESPSLRQALWWASKRRVPFGGFGPFSLQAQSSLANGELSLTNVNVQLDGNRAQGAMTLSTAGHRAVEGTLASDSLDLTPYVGGVQLLARNRDTWNRLPIALAGLADFDLDLRLSAATVQIGDAKLGRAAVAATMRGGKLSVTIGEVQAFGGVAEGSFVIGTDKGGIDVATQTQLSNVDLASCLGHMFRLHKLEGRGTLALNLRGSGSSVWAITHSLAGTASLKARDGALVGIDVARLLQRLEKRPLSGGGNYRSGRTPFHRLSLSLKIKQGQVSVENLQVVGPAVRVALTGHASVPERNLDLDGTATLVASAASNDFQLPFVVQGPWDDPIMLPDASSLILRSQAAAPLLEAIKRHSAGDALRSVIDQLFAAPHKSSNNKSVATTPAPAPSGAQ